jgi:hypothetical protein
LDLGMTFLGAGFLFLWYSDSLSTKLARTPKNLKKSLFYFRFLAVLMMVSGLVFLALLALKSP